MQPKTGKVNFTKSSVRVNVPNYYVKQLGLNEDTEWRIKETPVAYLLKNESGGTIHGFSYSTQGGKYRILAINIPLMEIDRSNMSGAILWEVTGKTVKATMPKGHRQSSKKDE